jgi:hypothetical protein
MDNQVVALKFLSCFCAGDINGLAPLLAEDLEFTGPFHRLRSRDEYLDILKNDPPEKCGFRVISISEDGDSVSVFYDYEKSDSSVTIAQLFKFRNQKISEILLVFDGRGFE